MKIHSICAALTSSSASCQSEEICIFNEYSLAAMTQVDSFNSFFKIHAKLILAVETESDESTLLHKAEEVERGRRGTADLYRSLGTGAYKYIRLQKKQRELLVFLEEAIKRQAADPPSYSLIFLLITRVMVAP